MILLPPACARRAASAVFAALAACALAAAPVHAANEITSWKAPRTPPLALADLDGAGWSLAQHKGKVVLVNFWATWCEPCRAEMPSMQKLAERFGARLVVVGVNYQEPEVRIRRFLAGTPVTFTILLDQDGQAARAWTRRIFPTTVLVGPDGRARTVVVGEIDWGSEEAEKLIRDLLPR